MKKNLLFLGGVFYSVVSAQVGIGNTVNTFDESEALKIVSTNKGVIIPNVSLTSLSSASPITSPATSLLVYNTNTTTGKGFYFWKNSKWNVLLDSTNIYAYLGIINSTTITSNAAITDNTRNGAVQYTIGEIQSAHEWQLIPNLSTNINLYSANNNITVNVNGVVQVVNTSSEPTTTNSYAIAIFVDDKLASVRNFIINAAAQCTYNDFNEMLTIQNLSLGTHSIKVYETFRTNVENDSNPTLTFGDKASTCNNLTTDMARTIMNIQITEKALL